MSLTRKKIQLEQINLASITEKNRKQYRKNAFKRGCCEKENENSRDSKQHRCKDDCKSSKKKTKKKFLQEEIQKMIQKRYKEEQERLGTLKQKDQFEISNLKYDVEEMKNVISKLSIEEYSSKDNTLKQMKNQTPLSIVLQFDEKKTMRQKQMDQSHENKRDTSFKQEILTLKKVIQQSKIKLQEDERLINNLKKEIQSQKLVNDTQNGQILTMGVRLKQKQINLTQVIDDRIRLEQSFQEMLDNKVKIEQEFKQLTIKWGKFVTDNFAQEDLQIQSLQAQNSQISSYTLTSSIKLFRNSNIQQKKTKNEYISSLQSQLKMIKIQMEQSNKKLQNYGSISIKFKQLEQQITNEKVQGQKVEKQTMNCLKEVNCAINRLNEQKGELEILLIGLKAKYEELYLLQDRVKGQNNRLFQDKVRLSKEIRCHQEEKLQMNVKIVQLETSLKDKQEELEKRRYKWEILLGQMKKQNEQMSSQIKCAKDQTKELEVVIKQLNHKSNKFQSKNTKKRQKIQQLQTQEATLKQFIKQKQSELAQMKTDIQVMKRQYCVSKQQYEKIKKQLQNDNEKYQKQIQKNGRYQKQLQKYKRDVFMINQQKQGLFLLMKNKQKIIQDKKMHSFNLQKEIESFKVDIQEKSRQNMELEVNNEQLKKRCFKIIQFQEQSKRKNQQIMELSEQLKKKGSKIMQAEENNEELKKKCSKFLQIQEQLKKKGNKIMQLQDISEQLKKKSRILQSECQSLKKSHSQKDSKINELKDIINQIKSESIYIKQQVKEYKSQLHQIETQRQMYCNKSQQQQKLLTCLEDETRQHIKYMRQRLDFLNLDKNDLQKQLSFLNQQYNALKIRFDHIQQQNILLSQRLIKDQQYQTMRQQIESIRLKFVGQEQKNITQRINFEEQVKIKEKSIEMLKSMLQEERVHYQTRLGQVQQKNITKDTMLLQETAHIKSLKKNVEDKNQEISQLNEKIRCYDVAKARVITQVRNIQSQISELADKNNNLQVLNTSLEAEVANLNGVIMRIKEESTQSKKRQSFIEQKYRRQISEIQNTCQQKKNQTVNILRQKMKQITQQLSLNIQKINTKNIQIEQLSKRYKDLQQLLKQNHQLLLDEKKERQRLMSCNSDLSRDVQKYKEQHYHHVEDYNQHTMQIDKYKQQIILKQKESQSHFREIAIINQKLLELQSKNQILKRKNENLEHNRQNLQRQIDNKQMSLRVLKGENSNLQAVMSEQISQRNGIIEQLVYEKKMLYAQMNNQ